MTYTAARAEVLSAATDSLVYLPAVEGFAVMPVAASAFVTVYDPNGSVKVARTAATINADGSLAYSRAWDATSFPIEQDYFAIWEFTSDDGIARADRVSFDVVKSKLPVLLTAKHLEEVVPRLREHLESLQDEEASPEMFALLGWHGLLQRIRAEGRRPSLILERDRLIEPARYLALALACDVLAKQPGDLWHTRAADYRKLHREFLGLLANLRYDIDEDNTTSKAESVSVNVPRFSV